MTNRVVLAVLRCLQKSERGLTYGFRDDEYFFLKIRSAFPGIP